MSRPNLKYFFGIALWAGVGLFAAVWLGLVDLGSEAFAIASGAMILLCIAGAWFVELLDRRLRELTRAAEEFATGVRRFQLDSPNTGAISALTDAFNQMSAATERRIATLQASLQQQRFIAEQSPDAMWVFDVGEFKLVDVNENFVNLSGYPRDELVGKTFMGVSPPTQAGGVPTEEYARGLVERTLRGEKVVEPWIIRTRDGEDVPCEMRAVHVPNTDRTLLCGSLVDVRQRLRTEAELRQRMRFENLIMLLSSGMSSLTAERLDASIHAALADIGEFAQVDRSYLFMFDDPGVSVTCTHEWCAEGIAPQIHRLRNLKVAQFPWVESRLQRGEVVHVPRVADLPPTAAAERAEWEAESIQSILLVPVSTHGKVRGYVGFDSVRAAKRWPPEAMDVLKIFGEILLNAIVRVQAETQLRQQNETLAATVRELERSNDELQQFAYISSHDLQEPLRSIGSFSELLERQYGANLDERGLSYLRFLTASAQRLQHLVAGLLDYSRIGARAAPFESTSMEDVLRLALGNLEGSIRDAGGKVTYDPLPLVPGDAAQLTLLLQHLVGNALKFRGAEPPRVHVAVRRARANEGHWEFSVTDNGIGITPADTRKLFQIFKRLHPSDRYPGIGIGLAVCKRIVERHNGRIWIESNPSGGSRFCFTLPRLAQQTSAAA